MRLLHPLGLLLALVTRTVTAEPVQARDQNPLLAGLGLPLPLPAELVTANATRMNMVANWSNTANSDLAPHEALLFDVESRELRLLIEHSFAERLSLRVQIPYRQLDGGILDSFIDDWHETFGMPEGPRPYLPRDDFRLAYLRNGQMQLDLRKSISGLGDVALEAGYQWWQTDRSAAALWLSVEAPTGSTRNLLGNGAWDAGAHAAGKLTTGTRSTVYWQLGVIRPGKGRYLAEWQKDWAASALAGFEYGIWRGLQLKAQLDAHSALYDSDADLLGPAFILTAGGDYRFASGWRLDFGISEDIKVEASPDVNFCFALAKTF